MSSGVFKGGMAMKRKLLAAMMALCACTSLSVAQVSVEEAERKLAQKQAVKPANKPATRPVDASAPNMDLFQQSLVELQAGNFKEAIATSGAFQGTLKRPVGKLTDPNWI